MATITVAAISLCGWPDGSDTLHGAIEGLELGLDALYETGLQLDMAPLPLNLDLLLLDETPLFFKLRTHLGHINHFASLEGPSMRAIRDGAHDNRTKRYALQTEKTVSFCTHWSRRPGHNQAP